MTAPAAVPSRPVVTPVRKEKRRWVGWGFMGPFMLAFAVVFVAPIIFALYLSFRRNQLIGGDVFAGVSNYQKAFADPAFWEGVGRVGLFLVVQVPIMTLIALWVALAIDSAKLYGRNFFRITVFMPYAVPAVVAALMWGFMYGTQFGLVGNLNDMFGWSIPDPLGPKWVLTSIGNIVTWEFTGYNMLILYSGLQTISRDLYEAAEIDGANQWQIIRAIKLPAIRGSIAISIIFSIIGSFQLFNEPSILKALAPNAITTSYTPNLYAYSLSFSGQQYNYSATIAIVMGVITMIIAYAFQLSAMRKER